ncbi:MAG: DUF6444 domain-containing protein [Planctomycetaceae bacterium]
MSPPSDLPITPEQMASLPPEFRAILQAVIDHYERQVTALKARVAELEAEVAALKAELNSVRKTPQNSSLPPSTQHPHAEPPAKKPKSKRKRGGQPGHPRHQRVLIPVEECAAVTSKITIPGPSRS